MAEQQIGSAAIKIVPDTAGFSAQAESKLTSELQSMAKRLGGAFAAERIFEFGKSSFEAFENVQKVAKQTEAVLQSTGAVAGVSAEQVDKLSKSISEKVGIDDEAIKSGENLLLTFTNIRNEVGKGNDIFNQATQAMVDMSVAMGGEGGAEAARVLGKALNDPLQGLQALTRVGVQFTATQKEQIQNFVAQGDIAKAQGIILDEVNKKFAGSAEAQATAADKARVSFDNLKEEIGAQLAPSINALAEDVQKLGGAFAELPQPLQDAFQVATISLRGYTGAWGEASIATIAAKAAVHQFTTEVNSFKPNFDQATAAIIGQNVNLGVFEQKMFDLIFGQRNFGSALALVTGYVKNQSQEVQNTAYAMQIWGDTTIGAIAGVKAAIDAASIGQALTAVTQGFIDADKVAYDAHQAELRAAASKSGKDQGDAMMSALDRAIASGVDPVIATLQDMFNKFATVGGGQLGPFGAQIESLAQGFGAGATLQQAQGRISDAVAQGLITSKTAHLVFARLIDLFLRQIQGMNFEDAQLLIQAAGLTGFIAFNPFGRKFELTSAQLPQFAQGGVVPGPIGAPQLVVAHGGEQILTRDQQGGINVNVFIDNVSHGDVADVAERAGQGVARVLVASGIAVGVRQSSGR